MLDFHASIWRCLSAIRHERPLRPSLIRRRRFAPYQSFAAASTSHSHSNQRTDHDGDGSVLDTKTAWREPKSKPGTQNSAGRPLKVEVERDTGNRSLWKELRGTPDDNSDAPTGVAAGVQGHIKRELVWLKDPLKLAERTRALLALNDVPKAFELVRLASRDAQCPLCWNALINHMLAHGKVKAAFQTYNDVMTRMPIWFTGYMTDLTLLQMKKRAQRPDAYTFSILLNGLARSTAKVPTAVAKALSLYHGMSGPASQIPPNIIHTNAALSVCARANDMDALWSIANSIPETGPNTADKVTFTTIFNALKADAGAGSYLDAKTRRPIASPATIIQARQLWGGIVTRWRSGDIIMDENLACAMGRLLLIGGRPQDWDDVLSLVEQTTGIRRRAPTLRSGRKRDEDDAELSPSVVGNIPRKAIDEYEPDAGSEFAPVVHNRSTNDRSMISKSTRGSSLMFATPSNKTLSLVMESCEKMELKKAATKYWECFTSQNGLRINPDPANCHTYLRIMRVAKSSNEAVEFLRTAMKHIPPQAKTYRIAMSTCVRNMLSRNVMTEAADLMDMMTNRLGRLDLTTCCMWMEIGLTSPHGKDTLVAVERLGPQQINLPRIYKEGDKYVKWVVLKLLRLMSSGINRILDQDLVRAERREEMVARMRKIDGYITRWTEEANVPLSREEVLVVREKKKLKRYAKIEQRERIRSKILANKTHATNELGTVTPVVRRDGASSVAGSHEKEHHSEIYGHLDRPRSFSDWKSTKPVERKRDRGIGESSEEDAQQALFQVRYGSHKYISKRQPSLSPDSPRSRHGTQIIDNPSLE
jgi:hypothetical protein